MPQVAARPNSFFIFLRQPSLSQLGGRKVQVVPGPKLVQVDKIRSCFAVTVENLEVGTEILPLSLLFCHKALKPRIAAQVVKILIVFKERITRKAVVRGHAEIPERILRLVHQRIIRGNDISDVMEMSPSLPLRECLSDLVLGRLSISSRSRQ